MKNMVIQSHLKRNQNNQMNKNRAKENKSKIKLSLNYSYYVLHQILRPYSSYGRKLYPILLLTSSYFPHLPQTLPTLFLLSFVFIYLFKVPCVSDTMPDRYTCLPLLDYFTEHHALGIRSSLCCVAVYGRILCFFP